ncbi:MULTISPECIES: hypothetical protein [Streptomyces]|uniref:hypothetical protein n=1 Tax=Streptomyces TaxID=1883 RepID=UPI00030428C9|nr:MULTISPECIES: hypothetical protein [Streptomyces]
MLSTIVLATGLTVAPQALTPGHPASAADVSCTTYSVSTYVFEPATSSNAASKRVLHKYMEWGPKSPDTDLLDTLYTASLPMTSKVFTGGGNGIIYEATGGGQVKSYKDNTATGGSLLTPVKTYSFNWSSAKQILANGHWILVIASDGTMDVYKQSSPDSGDGTITKVMDGAKSSVTSAIADADDAWMINSAVQWLKDGTIQQAAVTSLPPGPANLPPGPGIRLEAATSIATGVDAAQAWAPGPNAISTQSVTSDPDTTGQIRSFTTGPWTSADSDVRSGILGDVMADAGPCLTDPDQDTVPYFGTPPVADTDVPTAQESSDTAPSTPSNTITGRFTLGSGQPASGLTVMVTASDVDTGSDTATGGTEPLLGKATTASDGAWTLTLPSTLPANVKQAMDDNGGALNLNATTTATTSSGVQVLGADTLTAVPEQSKTALAAGTDASARAAEAINDNHTVPLIPDTVDDTAAKEPTADQEKQTFAAQTKADPQATGEMTPMWQSDHSTLAASYNPYLVGGKDISAETVTPHASGSCDTVKYKQTSKIKYTVVGEAHANWDSKASFDYDDTMNSAIDTAVNSNGDWKLGGSMQISSETGVSTGYPNKGSYYAHQYQVPIEYNKYKKQRICSGTVRATWYTIEPGRYKVPSGGSVGKIGKDVSAKDGSGNYGRAPKSYHAKVDNGTYFQLTRKKSAKFGNAVNFMGVGLGVTTGYDTNHKQKIIAGTRRNATHLIWGKNGPVHDKPGVFYSN